MQIKEKDLLDFSVSPKTSYFSFLFDPDKRIEKYLSASIPPSPFGFTGHGEITRESCGTFRGLYTCKNHPYMKTKPMFHSCNNILCPICCRKSISKKAVTIKSRFKNYINLLFLEGVSFLKPKHCSINPETYNNDDFKDEKSFTAYRKKIQEIAEKYFSGGVIVFHPFRIDKNSDKPKLYFSPHFHIIAFGWIPNDYYNDFPDNDKYIIKNHGSLSSLDDIYECVKYELSHCGFYKRKTPYDKTFKEYYYQGLRTSAGSMGLYDEIKDVTVHYETERSLSSYWWFGAIAPHNLRTGKSLSITKRERCNHCRQILRQIKSKYFIRIGKTTYSSEHESLFYQRIDHSVKFHLCEPLHLTKSKKVKTNLTRYYRKDDVFIIDAPDFMIGNPKQIEKRKDGRGLLKWNADI